MLLRMDPEKIDYSAILQEALRDAVRRNVPAAFVEISLRALAAGEALASAVAVPPHPAKDIPATAATRR